MPDPAGGAAGVRAPSLLRRHLGLVSAAAVGCVGVAGIAAYAASAGAGGATGSTATVTSGPGQGLPVLQAGRLAPLFRLPRLGGGAPVALAADRGHPVVLNFFASWCPDCRAELRAFGVVSRRAGSHVDFVGVDTNDPTPSEAISLLRAAGDTYPVGVDANATVANGRYLVEALPTTVFISGSGHIVGQVFGPQTVGSLTRWVDRLAAPTGGRRSSPRARSVASHGPGEP